MTKYDVEIISKVYEENENYLTILKDTLSIYFDSYIKEYLIDALSLPMTTFRYKFNEDELRQLSFQLNDLSLVSLRLTDVCQLIVEHISEVCSEFIVESQDYEEVIIKCNLESIRNKNKLYLIYKEFKRNKFHFDLITLTDLMTKNLLNIHHGNCEDIIIEEGSVLYDSVGSLLFLVTDIITTTNEYVNNDVTYTCLFFNGDDFTTFTFSYDRIKNYSLLVKKL